LLHCFISFISLNNDDDDDQHVLVNKDIQNPVGIASKVSLSYMDLDPQSNLRFLWARGER